MLALLLFGPAVPLPQTATLAEDLSNSNAKGAATSFADVREYLFIGVPRKTELCCATISDEKVRYVQIYKSNTQGFCSMLRSAENSTASNLNYSRLKQSWDQDSAAEECRDAFTFTFVRDPLDHFISGFSEITFRFNQTQNHRHSTECSMPPLSCYSWAAPWLNAAQRARAFVEDFAWGKLNSPCCDATRETELHVMPQVAFMMDALGGRLSMPVQQIDVLGKLEFIQEDWPRVAAAARGLPAQYPSEERFHESSDAFSGNEFRTAMEDLLQNDSSISQETRDAFCHQLRYDYSCFGYMPDRVCAHASPKAMEARCPLVVAEGKGGTYVAADGYSSWYVEQQQQQGWVLVAGADECPLGQRSADEAECFAAVQEAALTTLAWELAPSAQAKWACGAKQRNADANECLAAAVAATSGAANGHIKLVDAATVPPGCSYSHVSGAAMFNSGMGQVGSEKENYQLVCTPNEGIVAFKKVDEEPVTGVPQGCSYSERSKTALFNANDDGVPPGTHSNAGYQRVCLWVLGSTPWYAELPVK